MTCIDTHSHLYGEEFDADREEVVARARAAGVEKIFLPNINAASVSPMLEMCRKYPGVCYPMIGLHPEDIQDDWQQVLADMEQQLAQPGHPYIGIGEVGLDYYWDRSRYEEQQEVLRIQVEWALKYGLPLMIHTRSAHRELVNLLQQVFANLKSPGNTSPADPEPAHKPSRGAVSGVFHCFGGTADEARELLAFDHFMLGIGGVLTFKKSPLPEVLRQTVPLERIVLETDSPYLAPVPQRGKRNESAFVIHVAEKLAEIYEVSKEYVCEITSRNALGVFTKAR